MGLEHCEPQFQSEVSHLHGKYRLRTRDAAPAPSEFNAFVFRESDEHCYETHIKPIKMTLDGTSYIQTSIWLVLGSLALFFAVVFDINNKIQTGSTYSGMAAHHIRNDGSIISGQAEYS